MTATLTIETVDTFGTRRGIDVNGRTAAGHIVDRMLADPDIVSVVVWQYDDTNGFTCVSDASTK